MLEEQIVLHVNVFIKEVAHALYFTKLAI